MEAPVRKLEPMPTCATSFTSTGLADQANFTPEKIETRSDRLGQVYRAKVRILEGVERFQPGTEGNVYLLEADAERTASAAVAAPR